MPSFNSILRASASLGNDLGERVTNKSDSDGSNSSQNGSPTLDHHEDAEMDFYGSNGSATENEMATTTEDTNNSSEGVIRDVQHTEFENNDAQPVRRSETSYVSKVKYKSIGEIEGYKARYVVKGYNQKEGIDFDETLSLVVKIVTVRCLINLAVQNNWCLTQLDINNAFLYGDLFETMYMNLLEGYFSPDDKRQSKSDYSLFTKSENGNFTALLVYVDDIIITGNNSTKIENFKKFLKTRFEIKDLGKLKYFLGIEVLETKQEWNLSITNEPTDVDKFMHKPLRSHLRIALRVLRYLNGNPGKGVHIDKQPKASLEAFVDANWDKCLITRKSVTSFCIKLNGSLISYNSKKLHSLSKSSVEAEYKAIASDTFEVIWILKILKDLESDQMIPVNLFCDSQAAINIAVNPIFHKKTKHLENTYIL
nr:ribonuclease H-like domain-containing protein [Tanacetum cinerariifolium]